jgi:hypothetical protein
LRSAALQESLINKFSQIIYHLALLGLTEVLGIERITQVVGLKDTPYAAGDLVSAKA